MIVTTLAATAITTHDLVAIFAMIFALVLFICAGAGVDHPRAHVGWYGLAFLTVGLMILLIIK